MMRSLAAALALLLVLAVALPGTAQTTLIRVAGQLLDVRNGYVFFTTGNAFKLADAYRLNDYDTGAATTMKIRPRLYARAIIDPQSKLVVELDVTAHAIPNEALTVDLRPYIALQSTPAPNSELVQPEGARAPTGKQVSVVFEITVPPTTPIDADIFISTDASGWDPRAIRLYRVDGTHYKIASEFASGTRFAYRVTRGSWTSVEIGQNGLETSPHAFFVREVDSQLTRTTVYGWSDQRSNNPQAQPGVLPTPFNPNPFPAGPGSRVPAPRATLPGGVTPAPGPPNLPPQR